MKAVEITISNGVILEQELGALHGGLTSLRSGLVMYACRLFGREGINWRMVQARDGRLVPFFAREIGGLQSEIHAK